ATSPCRRAAAPAARPRRRYARTTRRHGLSCRCSLLVARCSSPRHFVTASPASNLQRLEADSVRLRPLLAQALLLVGLVLLVVAVEELHLRVALEGEDVGGDAVEE